MFDPDPAINEAFNTLYTVYPDELEIRLEEGSYSINQPLPYAVPMPVVWQDTHYGKKRIDHMYDSLAVFTTDEAIGTDAGNLMALNAPVVLTESRLYVLTDRRKEFYVIEELLDDVDEPVLISERLIRSFPPTMLTESVWLSRSFYVPVIALTFFVVSSLVLLAWNAFKAIAFALLAYVLFKLILHKRGLEYEDMLQVSLHVLVPIFVVRSILLFAFVPFGGIFWFGVYLVVLGFVHRMLLNEPSLASATVAKSSNVKTAKKKTESQSVVATPKKPAVKKKQVPSSEKQSAKKTTKKTATKKTTRTTAGKKKAPVKKTASTKKKSVSTKKLTKTAVKNPKATATKKPKAKKTAKNTSTSKKTTRRTTKPKKK